MYFKIEATRSEGNLNLDLLRTSEYSDSISSQITGVILPCITASKTLTTADDGFLASNPDTRILVSMTARILWSSISDKCNLLVDFINTQIRKQPVFCHTANLPKSIESLYP